MRIPRINGFSWRLSLCRRSIYKPTSWSGGSLPWYLIPLVVLFPILIGAVTGSLAAVVMKKISSPKRCAAVVWTGVLLTGVLTALAN